MVKRLTEGKSLRAISRTTKVSHTYVDDMRWGIIPSYVVLAQFADGLELSAEDRSELFRTAGYEGDAPIPSPTGAEIFLTGLSDLQQELGKPILLRPKLKPDLTPEEAEVLLADIRQQAVSGEN